MKQRAYTIRIAEYDAPEELPGDREKLVNMAIEAASGAYAPYSRYQVGASLLLDNGEIICGNNQENAASPSGLCAERVALFYAGARFPGVAVVSIAVAAIRNGLVQEEPVTPCGGCRQVLYEKERTGGQNMEVILCGSRKIQVLRSASDLMPLPFVFSPGS